MKSIPVQVRFSPEAIRDLRKLAKKAGLAVSTYIRMVMVKHLDAAGRNGEQK